MQPIKTILENTNNLIEEMVKVLTRTGKLRKITNKQALGKKAGYKWDSKRGMYVPQTGADKTAMRKAAIKRERTMNMNKGQRALASKKRALILGKARKKFHV